MQRQPQADARLLVVDDDVDGAYGVAEILDAWGYTTEIAHDLQSAMTLIDAFRPTLAFVDIRLGRDSGFEVITKLKSLHPAPIAIVMTANVDRETAIEAIRCGAFDYLPKPVDPEEMQHSLERAMTLSRLQSENRRMMDELKSAKEHAEKLAFTDWLTDLPNRRALYMRLEEILDANLSNEQKFALILLDLDGFKPVNDQLGHQAGDEILRLVGQRMARLVSEQDMAARLGGDEFGMIIHHGDREKIADLAQSLIDCVAMPFVLDGTQVNVGVSVGISIFRRGETTIDALVRATDQNLYEAKSRGRGRYVLVADEV